LPSNKKTGAGTVSNQGENSTCSRVVYAGFLPVCQADTIVPTDSVFIRHYPPLPVYLICSGTVKSVPPVD
jgi:hypothetical protein